MTPAVGPATSAGGFRSHRLTVREFEAAATGDGPFGTAELWRAERSRRLLLLDLLLDTRSDAAWTLGPLPSLDEAWDLLVAAQRRDGAEVDRLVLLPETGLWLASVLRRLHGPPGGRVGDPPLWVAVGHLHALAAS
ncbi:hypothetical protein GT354_10465, partial [Streptomyces sp. SID3343]|nr:hypothetical protein [Streptomyces sp. SID3343]